MLEWFISGLALTGTFVSYWITFECGGCCRLALEEMNATKIEDKIVIHLEKTEQRLKKHINEKLEIHRQYVNSTYKPFS